MQLWGGGAHPQRGRQRMAGMNVGNDAQCGDLAQAVRLRISQCRMGRLQSLFRLTKLEQGFGLAAQCFGFHIALPECDGTLLD